MKNTAILAAFCLLAPCSVMAQEPAAPAPAQEIAAASAYDALSAEQKAQVDALVTLCDQTTDTVKGILSGIKDRETADAAAPKLQAAFDQLDAAWDNVPEALWAALKERIQSQKTKAEEVNGLIQGLLHAERPFYGSIALASALGEVSEQEVNIAAPSAGEEGAEPATFSEEQLKAADGVMNEIRASVQKLSEALAAIKDKESADAAAKVLPALMKDFDDKGIALMTWAAEQGLSDNEACALELQKRYAPVIKSVEDLEVLVVKLSTTEPPFYGSEELQALFLSDEGDDTDEEETEE